MTVNEIVARDLAYTGVTKWHDAGFKGKGAIVLNCETDSGHGATTRKFIEYVAPECTIISGSLNRHFMNDKLVSATVSLDDVEYNFEQFVIDNKVKIVTASLCGDVDINEDWHKILLNLKNNYGVIFLSAAANEGDDADHENIYTWFSWDTSMAIGACSLATGKPVRCGYSGVGKELDFINTVMWWAGTSAATPFTAGEVALLIGRYGNLKYEQVYAYLKSHAMDVGTVGVDSYYGWGMPIMGDVKSTIVLTTGSNVLKLDGMDIVMDTMPIIDAKNRMLVPVRPIGEALGCIVTGVNIQVNGKTQVQATLKEK